MAAQSRRKTNVVVPLGSFFGRVRELERIAECFARGERLVTLLGAPGIGKSRLALRHAHQKGEPWLSQGGVWLCDLTEVRDVAGLSAAVATVLGVRLSADLDAESKSEALCSALADRGPILLVLDNFEQLSAAGARSVERWCAVASEACFLVTSRERLDVAGEQVVELPALDEASALFLDRARAAGCDDVHLAEDDTVAALVAVLDRIPLAIELAAARSRVLAPAELLSRLSAERSRLLPALTAAIDSSWNALSEPERSALAQCSVFAGDFSLEAAEAILDVASPIDLLASLCDRSLVRRSVDPTTGSTRFALFVSIQEYAARRAHERSEWDAPAARHRRHYVDATRGTADEHARTGDPGALARLSLEKDQLFAVQSRLRERKERDASESADLARAVLSLQPVIASESAFDPLPMLDAAIEGASLAADAATRGRLYLARARVHGARGAGPLSSSDLFAALELAEAIGDGVLEAEVRIHLGVRCRLEERFDEGRALGERAIALLTGADEPRLSGTAQACVGLLLFELGQAGEAETRNLKARAILSEAGDRWSEALPIANLAQLAQASGHFERARHGYERALERFRESGDRRYEGRYRGIAAGLELERGNLEAARAEFATALEILGVSRSAHLEGVTRAAFGALEAISGHAREAIVELDRAEDVLRTTIAPGFAAALDVHRGQVDLLLSRRARQAGERDKADALVASARGRIVRAANICSEDVRFAVRLLERELAREATQDESRSRMDVESEARRFRIAGRDVVDLGRRGALRLVLDGLVRSRLDAPGETLSWEALLGVGWPGERVLADAGATRVRVAVSTLRKLGLAGILLTREDGYLLDPRVPVRRTEAL